MTSRCVDPAFTFVGPARALTVPATLRDSLMARLDRLATVREIAQLGATIGRAFSYELLHAIACHHDSRSARTAEASVLYHANQLDAVAATRPIPE